MSDESKKTKPGPEPERLMIEDDPAEALDRLLGKRGGRGMTPEQVKAIFEAEVPGVRFDRIRYDLDGFKARVFDDESEPISPEIRVTGRMCRDMSPEDAQTVALNLRDSIRRRS